MRARHALLAFGLAGASAMACLFPDLGGLSTSDAAVEASTDAATDADADAGCDATFCDDFDLGPLGATWTDSRGLDAGYLSLGAPAVSPPNAFVVSIPDDAGFEGVLIKDLPKGSKVACGVTVFGDAFPTANTFVDVLYFLHGGSGSFVESNLIAAFAADGLTLREDVDLLDGGCSCPAFETTAVPLPQGVFFRLELETDFSTAKLSINGNVVASHAVASDPPTAVRVSLGMRTYGLAGAKIRYDDFACTVTP